MRCVAWSVGHSLRWRDICLANLALAVAAKKRFQSWRRVLAATEMADTQQLAKPKREWDRQAVIEYILRRKTEGKPLNYRAVRADDSSLLAAARRQFGNWRQAMAASEMASEPEANPSPQLEQPSVDGQ